MTKRSRDLVKRERRPPPPGAARSPGRRAVTLARSGAVVQGCAAHLACRIGGRALAAKRNAWPAVVFIPVAYADHVGGSCQLSGRVRAAMSRSGSRPGTGLLDRHGERAVLDGVLDQARGGSSAVLVVRGEPGIGKTALLDYAAGRAVGFRVVRAWGVESEMELAFAGLHQLCVPMLGRLDQLPGPQRDALAVAFGMREGPAPDRFLVGLAVLSLLAATAEDQPLACLVDDAQWLDRASVQCLAFAARRLLAEPVAVILAARQPDDHDELAGLPGLTVTGLGDADARALLASAVGGRLDAEVRDRIVAETGGNPLALLQLPRGLGRAELAGGFWLPDPRPLASRIETSFLRQFRALPRETQRLLLTAAAEPTGDVTLLWRGRAAGHPGRRRGSCRGRWADRAGRAGALRSSPGPLRGLPGGLRRGAAGSAPGIGRGDRSGRRC
jgi:AAA ATPase domain